MTKTTHRNTGKYRNLRQNNVFGSVFIQNVQIWAKFVEFGPFDRVLLKPLLIFCCILSAWAQKWQRQHTETPASTEICDKTTFLGQFSYKTSKFGPNSVKRSKFDEFGPNLDVLYENWPKNVVLSQISVLAGVSVCCLCHFCAQADRLQQKMTKGSKKSRLKGRIDEICTELTLRAKSKQFRCFVANFGTYQWISWSPWAFSCSAW